MKTVRISYDPDLKLIGKVRRVEDDVARRMVFEGRAVLVEQVSELVDMSRADLVTKAKELGLPATGTKKSLAEAIRAAEAGRTPPTPEGEDGGESAEADA